MGDWVVAVGNPFGLGGTVTAGIVSAQGRDIGSGPYDYMQIDAAVNRGNSGGPTFNLDGEVVGVNTAIYSPSGGNVGIAFAIPAKTASDVVTQLKKSGSVNRGWLGVKIQNIDEDTAASLGLAEAQGCAHHRGHHAGARGRVRPQERRRHPVTSTADAVADSRDLARQIAGFAPNAKVDVRILRGQKEQTIAVKLGKFPSGKELAKVETGEPDDPAPTKGTEMDQLGLTVAPGSGPNKDGVVDHRGRQRLRCRPEGHQVRRRDPGGRRRLGKEPRGCRQRLKEAAKLGRKAVLIRVKSGDQTRFVAVQLKKS